MRPLVCAAATVVLIASSACRKQQSNETAGMNDTTPAATMAAEPAPAMPDTVSSSGGFSFDQRQDFVQSIRQQLTGIDRQIRELSAQAKSRGGAVSDHALTNVRAARRAVERDLSRVNTATAANWEQLREGVTRAVDNLNQAIEVAQPK